MWTMYMQGVNPVEASVLVPGEHLADSARYVDRYSETPNIVSLAWLLPPSNHLWESDT